VFLLADKRVRKRAAKTAKTAAKTAQIVIPVVGGGLLLYSWLKNRKPVEYIEGPTEYIAPPPTTTQSEVVEIARETTYSTLGDIERLKTELNEKISLREQQKQKIDEIKAQIQDVQQQILQKQTELDLCSFVRIIAETEQQIPALRSNYDTARTAVYNARNRTGAAQATVANLEYELQQIYARNEWWNPAWYLQKGDKEVELQRARSELETARLNQQNLESILLERENALNEALQRKNDALAQKNAWIGQYITPLENQSLALEQTRNSYTIAFDAINLEIQRLQTTLQTAGGG
jgi:DNA repair exonuclease SbcCD ATPase subunit